MRARPRNTVVRDEVEREGKIGSSRETKFYGNTIYNRAREQ